MTNNIIAQIVSIITIITTVFGLLTKEKFKTMLWFFASNLSLLTTYLLLGRVLGAILVAGAAIRTLVYFYYSLKSIKPSPLILVFFEVYFIAISLFLWKNVVDLFMLINLCLVTYTTWQNNAKLLRIGSSLSAVLLITYDIFVGAYVSSISEFILLGFTVYSIYRIDIANKIKNIVLHFYKTISKNYDITFLENEDNVIVKSGKISDYFNNFVYVKDVLKFENNLQPALKLLNEDKKINTVYLHTENNENIEFIYNVIKNHRLLYHDVWMKLQQGHNVRKKGVLLDNLLFKEAQEEDYENALDVFDKGFVHTLGENVYKYGEEYYTAYKEKITNGNFKSANFIPYVCYLEGQAIAVLFTYTNGTNAYLCQITTLVNYRRKGVASALMDYAINHLRKKFDCVDFYLITEKYTYLEGFYHKNNFFEIAQGFCISYGQPPLREVLTKDSTSVYNSGEPFVTISLKEYEAFLKWQKKKKKE